MEWFDRLRRRIGGVPVTESDPEVPKLPPEGRWLVDVPLFVDEALVERFNDTVLRPIGNEYSEIPTGKETTEGGQSTRSLSATAKLEGQTPFGLLDILPTLETTGEVSRSESEATTTRYELVSTPIRQLIQIIFHYHTQIPDRLYIQSDPDVGEWIQSETIAERPRELVMLDLPGYYESQDKEVVSTTLIPVAAEFSDGSVVTFRSRLDTDTEKPLRYPSPEDPKYNDRKQKYWEWFRERYDAQRTVSVVEEAASRHGRIRWIDFRVPITASRTLELHFTPAEKHDTGKFAYDLIARGYRYGIRTVGILKSGPTMEVMAVYNK